MELILEMKQVSKYYENFKLENINLQLPKGTIMGLIGENGAGKTTTIKLILNAIKKDSGSIRVMGMDHIKEEKKIKEQIGVVLDEGFFSDMLSAKDISSIMQQWYSAWDINCFKQYLEQFKVPFKQSTKQFSKGMKMKLSIATALAHHPKLLILDEPTSGLDPIVCNEILDIFMNLIQDEEKSILFSTHITSALEHIADYIAFLNKGRLIFTKPKDELLEEYGILKCSNEDFVKIDKNDWLKYRKSNYGYEVLVKNRHRCKKKYESMVIDKPSIEDIMLIYIKGED